MYKYLSPEQKNLIIGVCKKYSVKKAVLFGSYAKGTAGDESDVDLMVDSGLRGLKFISLCEDISHSLGKKTDIFDFSHIVKNSKIADEINGSGVILYES